MKIMTVAMVVAAASLAGCANKYDTVTPELQASMMSDLRAGKPNLDCGLKCKLTWESQAPSIHALDIAERWPDLAVRVMQIGYGSDLAYYYLGQSAQGLQYHQAAIAYYNDAGAVSAGGNALLRCEDAKSDTGNACQGVDIAASLPVLVQASRDALAAEQAKELAAQTPAPVVHHRHHKAATTPVAQHPDGWATPPPLPASDAAQPAQAQPASSQGPGWVAPPAQ